MTDVIIKKIFDVTTASAVDALSVKTTTAKEKALTQLAREKYYSELQEQFTSAIKEIILKGRQDSSVTSDFYEKELLSLLTRLNAGIASIKDDAQKSIGAMTAYDDALTQVKGLTSIFENELAKVKDLQDRADAGLLDKPRKPGTRPDKLKDIRNYVEPEKDK